MEKETTVAIVGAGPAGLAVGACLRQAGLDFVILEKAQETAASWRGHYERLHLHTVKRFSALPFAPFPENYPRYVPRRLMVDYLDAYAAKFDLRPRFGATVRAIRRSENRWLVESTSGSLRATSVVIASGYNAEPVTPAFPGIERFRGKAIHSADYRDAASFAGQRVLVVGMGNTGAEIALDLAEAGARPTISVRDGVHIVPRELFGVPIQMVAMLATKTLPARANDRIFPFILDAALGDLKKFGVRRPKEGILARVAGSARIPVIDVGTVRGISSGAIRVAPGVSEITETGVVYADARRADFDAIILATGYRPNYRGLFETADVPEGHGPNNGRGTASDIHFIGFNNVVTGLLREISKEATQIANAIRNCEGELESAHRH